MKEHWIDVPQGRVYAVSWHPVEPVEVGLSPIVLFHDSLGCVALWRDFPARLSQATGREVVAYDRLGFGRSDPFPGQLSLSFVSDEAKGTFAALRKQLTLDRFVVFGHSVGGGMAAVTAGLYSDKCDALITEAAQAFVEDRTLAGILDARQAFSEANQLERLKRYHAEKAEWVLSAWIDTWLSEDFRAWSLDSMLPRVTCPTLAIHGEHDEYGSTRHPERIAGLTTGPAVTEIVEGCGHVPHRENEDYVISAVKRFLGQTAFAQLSAS
ncbi:alpha/beta fold hydrolase [Vreelandella zhuhanensis]|uniref:alpha/beta fold hydrolase n=1 Tax=Vreelandella zhuhanensis TaxID=2684210 RepID=UPI0029E8057A|nr:alpha/beta hydrolase [Halomonas zhuhanensis]